MVIFKILNIRLRQLMRTIVQFHVVRTLFALALLVFSLSALYGFFNSTTSVVYGLGAATLLLIFVHTSRKDTGFIPIICKYPAAIYFVEYSLLMLPIIAVVLFTQQWWCVFAIITIAGLVSLLSYQQNYTLTLFISIKYIPSDNFEWISGLRKSPIVIVFYALAWALCYFPYATPVILWLFTIMTMSFYEENESVSVLLAGERSVSRFLKWKIGTHLKLYLLVVLPVIVVNGIINYSTWYVSLIILVLCILNFVFFIISKYSNYIPATRQPVNMANTGLVLMGNILPPFMPVIFFMLVCNANKAHVALNHYLHDYN